MDFEIILFDRIKAIQETNKLYDLENNSYISFSGGKDSVVVHYLIDLALPGNKIPRVFINTGIEYLDIVKYVKELASNDDRFIIIQPSQNIKETLEKYGYPFKSKEHSQKVFEYNRSGLLPYLKRYVEGINEATGKKSNFSCPLQLKYQFTEDFKNNGFKVSQFCCKKLKKEPIKKYETKSKRYIGITGMRSEEGGFRKQLGCITQKGKRFNPLVVITEDWENEFIKQNNIKLCKLYYPPFNFKRTGCKGCPFALNLQEQLTVMEKYLPQERRQCEMIWKPVYEEYRKLGYRLDKIEKIKLF